MYVTVFHVGMALIFSRSVATPLVLTVWPIYLTCVKELTLGEFQLQTGLCESIITLSSRCRLVSISGAVTITVSKYNNNGLHWSPFIMLSMGLWKVAGAEVRSKRHNFPVPQGRSHGEFRLTLGIDIQRRLPVLSDQIYHTEIFASRESLQTFNNPGQRL